jgi:hypothetical protein
LTTFEIAAEAIRRVLGPSAEIAGPSVSAFRWDWLRALVDHCLAARCQVNVVTWHELPSGSTSIASIGDHLRSARPRILASPELAPVGAGEIVIN